MTRVRPVRLAARGERPVAERRSCPRHLGLERREPEGDVRRTASARTSSRIIASAAA